MFSLFSFRSPTNSKYLDFMSCSLTDMNYDGKEKAQKKLLTTSAQTRTVPCSIFHYHVNICIHCFSFQAFFLWMSYGQERVI